MRFTLTIECDNAAFGDTVGERNTETARILYSVFKRLGAESESGTLRDANGNTVGRFGFEETP